MDFLSFFLRFLSFVVLDKDVVVVVSEIDKLDNGVFDIVLVF